MNILVQNMSEIWGAKFVKDGEEKLPISPKMFNGSKIGLLGGQKNSSNFHGYNIPNNDILRLKFQ